jgi:hypothetical protein
MLADLPAYCDSNITNCSVDFHDFTCDEEYIATCSELGNYAEFDETEVCTFPDHDILTTRSLDKVTCVPAICTANEIVALLDAPTVVVGGSGGTCDLKNIKVNGENIEDFSPFIGGSGEDGNLLAFIMLVAVVVLVCVAGCLGCRYKKSQQDNFMTKEQPEIVEDPPQQATASNKQPMTLQVVPPQQALASMISEPASAGAKEIGV